MAERDEPRGQIADASLALHQHGVEDGVLGPRRAVVVDQHGRQAQSGDGARIGQARDAGQDDAVDMRLRKRAGQAERLQIFVLDEVQDHAPAPAPRRLFDALQHVHPVAFAAGAGELRADQAGDRAHRLAGGRFASLRRACGRDRTVMLVLEPCGRIQHPLPRGGRNGRMAVQRFRDGRARQPEHSGDVAGGGFSFHWTGCSPAGHARIVLTTVSINLFNLLKS